MKATVDSPAPGDTLVLPAHPQGGEWTCSLGHGSGQLTFADTLGELIGVILPGYDDLDDTDAGHDEALARRHDHLLQIAAQAQAGINAQAADKGDFDPATAGEDVLTGLMQDRAEPWRGIATSTGTTDYEWRFKVPLVCVATVYQPFTDAPRPTGRVMWLDPSLESSYLASLADLGLIDFRTRQG